MHAWLLKELERITPEERRILDGSDEIDRALYMDGAADTVSHQKLLDSGRLIALRGHTRFVHFPPHTHDFVEVVYMCRGRTTHLVDGREIVLKQGELLFLSQNATQEILPAGAGDIAVNFIVLPAFFDRTLAMMGESQSPLRNFIVDCLRSRGGASGFLHFEVADVMEVQNLVENLIWSLMHDEPNRRGVQQTTMGLLFLHLLNSADRIVASDSGEERAIRVLKYVEERYRDGSLAELAGLMHYDVCWLSREIRRLTGKTYTEHVQGRRLAQAKFLLESTGLSVSEIAAAVGYENASYFHRIFRMETGISPKSYRALRSAAVRQREG